MASTAVLQRTPSSPAKKNREERIRQLKTIVRDQNVDEDDEEKIRNKELGILKLGELYQKEGRAEEIADLIKQTRPFLRLISKAKAAKLVRSLVDLFLDLESGIGIEVDLCRECIEWAREERRTFLRQSLESRLVALYLDRGMYKDALVMCCGLLKELKKMDDKALLVEVRLLESKTYHALGNVPRAKAALISARADANAIYCPPLLQAALDMQSGILHAADDGDFQTALSYFYEAFRGYDDFCPKRALMALKYMLLSKVMLRQTHDMDKLMGGRLTLKYSGRDLDAMVAIGKASSDRSLADFQSSVKNFKHELEDDPVVKAHLGALYNNMVEQNLCRIVEPYSRIEVDFIAKTIRLPVQQVEQKLTEMILDDKLKATLDKGSVLIVFDETPADRTYDLAIETIHSMAKVVDALYLKAKKLS